MDAGPAVFNVRRPGWIRFPSIPATFLEGLFRGKLNTETGPWAGFSSFRAPVKPGSWRRQTSGSCANNCPETVELLSKTALLSSEIADLNVHINRLVEQSRTGLIDITGVGVLVAARILAEVGDVP